MLSTELFIHLSFITLYNDSEMKGKTRLRKEGEIEERGLVVFAWLASAECRCLPRAKGASSSPLGFLFACGAEEGCGLSPRPIAEVTLTSNPILNSGYQTFWDLVTHGQILRFLSYDLRCREEEEDGRGKDEAGGLLPPPRSLCDWLVCLC